MCLKARRQATIPMYPDISVFRREGKKIKIDIVDPHDEPPGDAAEKAVRLANFRFEAFSGTV